LTPELEDRVFEYFARRRGASPTQLASSLETSERELMPVLDSMAEDGLISRGWVRFIESPDPEIPFFTLQAAGERQIALRGLGGDEQEPLIVTRAELIDEFARRGFGTREDLAISAYLRADRFHFWPVEGAFTPYMSND
jgi:hypothetical protein